jgi:hypothetical protein
MSVDSFQAKDTLSVGDNSYDYFRLGAVQGEGLDVASLPFSLKILLEALLRTEDGADITAEHIKALAGWDPSAEPDQEIQFTPARVIMQDFTGVPCVVDLATMREAMADLGGDPAKVNPLAPAEMVIDHSVIADFFGTPDAFEPQRGHRVRAQPRALPVPALGPGRLRRLQGRSAGHRHRPPGQHREPRSRRLPACGHGAPGLPRHLRRHRLPHHHGQRPGRRRLGRRRHRSRGGHARPTVSACSSRASSASSSPASCPTGATATDLVLTITEMLRPQGRRQVRRVLRPRRQPRCRWPTAPRSAT